MKEAYVISRVRSLMKLRIPRTRAAWLGILRGGETAGLTGRCAWYRARLQRGRL